MSLLLPLSLLLHSGGGLEVFSVVGSDGEGDGNGDGVVCGCACWCYRCHS